MDDLLLTNLHELAQEAEICLKYADDEKDSSARTDSMNPPELDAITELVNYLIRMNSREGKEAQIGCLGQFALVLHAYLIAPIPAPLNIVEEASDSCLNKPQHEQQQDTHLTSPSPPQFLFAAAMKEFHQISVDGDKILSPSDCESESEDEYINFDDSETDWSHLAEDLSMRYRLGKISTIDVSG